MFIGQLSGRKSLRDIVMNVAAQSNKLYHLAIRPFSRATLARVNEQQPASMFEAFFQAPCSMSTDQPWTPLQI